VLGPQRHYVVVDLLALLAVVGPFLHQAAALIENVAALIGALKSIALT
jgi:hypothetical protein